MNRIALILALTVSTAALAYEPAGQLLYCADTIENRDGTVTCLGPEAAWCCDPSSGACSVTDDICPASDIAVWCQPGESPVYSNGEWSCQED